MKTQQIPHVIFETTSQFFFKFLMRDTSSALFQLKLYMIFRKGAYRSAKCQTFDCLGEISPNLYFDRLLLLKVYKISGKNVQRSYVSWYWRVVQNLKKNRFFVSKITGTWWILNPSTKKFKKCALWSVPFVQSI